jgi:hypothetical protein
MHGPDRDARGLAGNAAGDFEGGWADGFDGGACAADSHEDADLSGPMPSEVMKAATTAISWA